MSEILVRLFPAMLLAPVGVMLVLSIGDCLLKSREARNRHDWTAEYSFGSEAIAAGAGLGTVLGVIGALVYFAVTLS